MQRLFDRRAFCDRDSGFKLSGDAGLKTEPVEIERQAVTQIHGCSRWNLSQSNSGRKARLRAKVPLPGRATPGL